MTKEQMEGEFNYRTSLYIVKELHKKGLITKSELENMKARLLEKYTPVISALGG